MNYIQINKDHGKNIKQIVCTPRWYSSSKALDVHLISTFTWLQLFICQIHLVQAKWAFFISLVAHGDSALIVEEAR